jgi:hypothetical protein
MVQKTISLFTTLLLFSVVGFSQILLERTSLLENQIEMLIPTGFSQLSKEMIAIKYPTDTPNWAITDKNAKVNLTYTYTQLFMDDNSIPGYSDELLTKIRTNLKNIEYIDDGILLQDGKNIGYIKFISQAKNEKIFNYFFYISLNNRLLLFNFTCTNKWRDKWEVKAEEIANSIRAITLN